MAKRGLMVALLRLINSPCLKDEREIIVRLPDGSEATIKLKIREAPKLKLIKKG